MRGARLRAVLTGADDDRCLIVVASASVEVGHRVVLEERLGLWTEQAAWNHAIRKWTPADRIHDLNRAAERIDRVREVAASFELSRHNRRLRRRRVIHQPLVAKEDVGRVAKPA